MFASVPTGSRDKQNTGENDTPTHDAKDEFSFGVMASNFVSKVFAQGEKQVDSVKASVDAKVHELRDEGKQRVSEAWAQGEEQFDTVKSGLDAKVHELQEEGKQRIEHAKSDINEQINYLREQGEDRLDGVADQLKDLSQQAHDKRMLVSEHRLGLVG